MSSLELYNSELLVSFSGKIEIEYKIKHEKSNLKNADNINYNNLSGTRYTVEAKIYNYTAQDLAKLKKHWQSFTLLKIDGKNEGKHRFWSPKIGYYENKYSPVPFLFIKCVSDSYIGNGDTVIRFSDIDIFFDNTDIFFDRR